MATSQEELMYPYTETPARAAIVRALDNAQANYQTAADLKEHALAIERGEFLPVKEVESQRVKECQ